VDEELKGLGIDSNRKIECLQRLVGLLDDPQHAATARKLLSRYTDRGSRPRRRGGNGWMRTRRIYFTEVGGFKFKVVPEGYLVAK
jgi:hypothetical protein